MIMRMKMKKKMTKKKMIKINKIGQQIYKKMMMIFSNNSKIIKRFNKNQKKKNILKKLIQ